jgi:hypothetical protein
MLKREFIVPAVYLLLVLVGLFLAIPSTQNNDWALFGMVLLTLPWGILSFFTIMFAIHQGFENEAAIVCFALGGFLNALFLYFLSRKKSLSILLALLWVRINL